MFFTALPASRGTLRASVHMSAPLPAGFLRRRMARYHQPVFKDSHENIFLVFEILVAQSARDIGPLGDIVQRGLEKPKEKHQRAASSIVSRRSVLASWVNLAVMSKNWLLRLAR
jgi:hypothetical protein